MVTSRAWFRALGACGLVLGSDSGPALAVDQPAGWELVWADEFDGTTLDPTKWFAQNVAWPYNAEQQYYWPGNATVADGKLTILAERRPRGGRAYSSARIESDNRFEFLYGRVEGRMKLPKTRGLWPAFWLLPSDTWPPEVDIMELLGHEPNKVYFTNHWGTAQNPQSFGSSFTGPDFSADFHDFAAEWYSTHVDFYVDGVRRATHNFAIPQVPMFIILNTAVGGLWPGNPDATTILPQRMEVDWVRVYREALRNGSFEGYGPTINVPLWGWSRFGNAFVDTSRGRTGPSAAKLFGNFSGGFNTSGIYQDRPAQPGQRWELSAFWRNDAGDPMQPGNTTALNIEWRTQAGQLISFESVPAIHSGTPTNRYTEFRVSGVAPPGTGRARAVMLFFQPAMAAGAAFIDDADFRVVPECGPDFNGDGFLDFFDLDDFVRCFEGEACPPGQDADFNNDGFIDFFDADDYVAAFEAGC